VARSVMGSVKRWRDGSMTVLGPWNTSSIRSSRSLASPLAASYPAGAAGAAQGAGRGRPLTRPQGPSSAAATSDRTRVIKSRSPRRSDRRLHMKRP
jgi:hypothetical protein